MFGPLRDAVHRAARRLQHLPGARVDLAGDEERDQDVGELREVAFALDEIVLVAAVGVAGAVGVVLEEEHLTPDAFFAQALLGALDEAFENALSGLVVDDEVADRVTLGGGVLGVAADVEIEPGAVLEEDVAGPAPGHDPAEKVAGHLVRAQPALAAQGAGDAVFVLEAEDAAVHWRGVYGAPVAPMRRRLTIIFCADAAETHRRVRRSEGAVGFCADAAETHRRVRRSEGAVGMAMTRLTSVYGSFRARVVAARLEDEGFDVQLRGALDSPYGLTVGDMARVDLYVPDEQFDQASLVLLVAEVDEADDILDDDRPPVRRRPVPVVWVSALILFVLLAGPIALLIRWY